MAKLPQDTVTAPPDAGDGFSLPKFDPIPNGDYLVVAEKGGEDKIQKIREANGSERYTALTVCFAFVVLEGPHQGRKIFDQIALIHDKPAYQASCFARLKAYFKAAGLPDLQAGDDSDDLHGNVFMVRVGIEKGGPKADKPGEFWLDKNKVLGAYPANQADVLTVGKAPPPPPPPPKSKSLSFADPDPLGEPLDIRAMPNFDDDIPF